eukprot:TRINITY_DN55225_c0_g1_i1.p1 TRINITY_DN55225_c0_g1~~TRINITY_DN55225_c0_g1_i1.p1  ORF type:complete len:481 (-),score=50.03 TRINITY_DN55225_c0_g1_i1:14-1456(-)
MGLALSRVSESDAAHNVIMVFRQVAGPRCRCTVKSLSTFIRNLNPSLTAEEVNKIFRHLRKGNDGIVELDEFLSWVFGLRRGSPELYALALRAVSRRQLADIAQRSYSVKPSVWPPGWIEPLEEPRRGKKRDVEREAHEALGDKLLDRCLLEYDSCPSPAEISARHLLQVANAPRFDANAIPFPRSQNTTRHIRDSFEHSSIMSGSSHWSETLVYASQVPFGDIEARLKEAHGRLHEKTEIELWAVGPDAAPFPVPWHRHAEGIVSNPIRARHKLLPSVVEAESEVLRRWTTELATGPGDLRADLTSESTLDTSMPSGSVSVWLLYDVGVIAKDCRTQEQIQAHRFSSGPPSEAARKVRITRKPLAEWAGERFFQEILPSLEKEAALEALRSRRTLDRAQELAMYERAAAEGAAIVAWPSDHRWPPLPVEWERKRRRLFVQVTDDFHPYRRPRFRRRRRGHAHTTPSCLPSAALINNYFM